MDIEQFRAHCISLGAVTEEFPFDETTLVFKIYGKMFAFISLEGVPFQAALKCEPELAIELREQHNYVLPGYHMNKKHWNTILIEEAPDHLLRQWIEHSFDEVVKKVPKSKRI